MAIREQSLAAVSHIRQVWIHHHLRFLRPVETMSPSTECMRWRLLSRCRIQQNQTRDVNPKISHPSYRTPCSKQCVANRMGGYIIGFEIRIRFLHLQEPVSQPKQQSYQSHSRKNPRHKCAGKTWDAGVKEVFYVHAIQETVDGFRMEKNIFVGSGRIKLYIYISC